MKNDTQVRIFVGTGGVGKTTLAAAYAYFRAQEGYKTLVVTIDPAQRLKTALGLLPHGHNQKVLPHPSGGWGDDGIWGEMWASLLDSKWVFDDFVRRGLKDEEKILRLFKNRLYQQLSTQLNGSQEFTSLEKLLYEYESGMWDFIVLDTPPAGHAIDFLKAPQKLNRLLDERVARWFRLMEDGGSWVTNIFTFGARRILQILEFLTGNEFIHELSDFFGQLHFWQKKLEKRLNEVDQLLRSSLCKFTLVTQYDLPKLREGMAFLDILKAEQMNCEGIVINRAYLESDFNLQETDRSDLKAWFDQLVTYYDRRAKEGRSLIRRLNPSLPIFEVPDKIYTFLGGEESVTKGQKRSEISLIVEIARYLRTPAS
ncbi:MAG: AAA family ATPase [Bdellovibrionaceae bacterium]|nr:AAA family ATPase [Pseudobdellovibrionaceae bacterium]MDW8189555.1 ArsA-related P-loop ATPase [Pseudobdellovibrionaceae bacterium]